MPKDIRPTPIRLELSKTVARQPVNMRNWPEFGSDALVRGAVFLGGAVPVPSVCEVRGYGYDAIAQVRDTLATETVRRSVARAHAVTIPLPDPLDDALRNTIDDVIASNPVMAPVVSGRPTTAQAPVEFQPQHFLLEVTQPTVDFAAGSSTRCALRWQVVLKLRLVETDASHRARVNLSDLPRFIDPAEVVNTEPVSAEPVAATATWTLEDEIELELEASAYAVLPRFNVSRAASRVDSKHPRFAVLNATTIQPAMDTLHASFGRVPLGPEISLGGGLFRGEMLAGLGAFEVHVATGAGNTGRTSVLSLCMLVREGGRAGRASAVKAFVGTRNFGYFTSESIARAAANKNWPRTSIRKSYRGVTSIPLQFHGEPAIGQADVHIQFQHLDDVTIVVGLDEASDALRMKCRYQIQLLRVIDPDGIEVPDLGEFGEPEVVEGGFDVRPFDSSDTPDIPASALFLMDLTRGVLYPVLRPTGPMWQLARFEGTVSQAGGAVLSRGDLEPR